MRLIRETVAQDLIEYALLTAAIAFSSWIAWQEIVPTLTRAQVTTEQRMDQLNACTPNPQSTGSTGC